MLLVVSRYAFLIRIMYNSVIQSTEDIYMKKTEAQLANQALELLGSFRGRIIVGRALNHIIAEMEKVEDGMREVSTLEDMYLIRDHFGIDLSD